MLLPAAPPGPAPAADVSRLSRRPCRWVRHRHLVGLEGAAADRVARAHELADSGEFEGILALASLGAAADRRARRARLVIVADYDESCAALGALADGAACGEVVRIWPISATAASSISPARGLRLRSQPPEDLPRHHRRARPVRHGHRRRLAGRVRLRAVSASRPTPRSPAVVAANDSVAMGAIRAACGAVGRCPTTQCVRLGRRRARSLHHTVAVDRRHRPGTSGTRGDGAADRPDPRRRSARCPTSARCTPSSRASRSVRCQ